jgi:hypothetical protein
VVDCHRAGQFGAVPVGDRRHGRDRHPYGHTSIQSGTSNGTTTRGGATTLPATGTATASAGNNSEPLKLAASVFNSGTSAAVPQTFKLQAEPVGNDTATASGALSLLYGSGRGAPAETALKIAGNGQIAFATGQAFL